MNELAFDLKSVQKDDKTIDYSVVNEKWRLPKHAVVHVFDTTTGQMTRFYVDSVVQPNYASSAFTHKLVPLPCCKGEACWG